MVVPFVVLLSSYGAAADRPGGAASQRQAVDFLGLRTSLPSGWHRTEPTSSMRLAQYSVDGNGKDQSAELIFYYFGRGQGGTAEANIARWQSQFRGPDGTAPQPAVSNLEVSGMPLTRVRLQGSYARRIGVGPGGTGKPDQTLIAALLQTPEGQVTIQLHGDTRLVDSLEPDFDDMLLGIVPRDSR
jgi:hypothetical protein